VEEGGAERSRARGASVPVFSSFYSPGLFISIHAYRVFLLFPFCHGGGRRRRRPGGREGGREGEASGGEIPFSAFLTPLLALLFVCV